MQQEQMMGFWYSPEAYQYASGLPVLKSLRVIVASLIRERIATFGTQIVLSLGIGTGNMYKELLSDELRDGSLKVIGIDSSASMLRQCTEGLPILVKILEKPRIPARQELILVRQSILNDFGLDPETVDIVEAVLVLHHVAYRAQLEGIIQRLHSTLKEDGVFIVGDIDLSLGAYIENKERRLKAKYASVERDLDLGGFVCKSADGETRLVSILEKDVESDRQLMEYAMSESFLRLEKEALLYGTMETREVLGIEIESFMKGGELNRSLEEWRDISLAVFGQNSAHRVLGPEDIRGQFSEVLDRPFVLTVQKAKESPRASLHLPKTPQVAKPDYEKIEKVLSIKAELFSWVSDPTQMRRYSTESRTHISCGKAGP